MENETLFAKRLTRHLDDSLDGLPQHVQVRLVLAREQAISHLRAKPMNASISVGNGLLGLDLGFFKRKITFATLALALALTGAGAIQYNKLQDTANAAADLDEEILSDDAPVQAYMDPVFSSVFHSGLLGKREEK